MTVGTVRESARRNGPDQLRGLLLTLVIFGHTYAARLDEDLGKWVIYGFHMPVFFAISGYLWRWDSLAGRTLPNLLRYFWSRMLWQWLLVSVLFNLYQGKLPAGPRTTVGLIFLEPNYHLWFIPALVLMVVVTHVVIRSGCGWWTLAAAAVIGLAVWELPAGKGMIPESLGDVDKRYFAYFAWFLLGFAMRNLSVWKPPAWVGAPFAVAGMAVYVHAYGRGDWEHDAGFVLLNVGLIIAVPALFAALDRPLPLIGDAMVTIGKGSLWVYLLHPFLTTYLVDHYDDGGWLGRLMGLVATAGIVAISTVLLTLTAAQPSRPGRHHPKVEAPVEAVPPDDPADAEDAEDAEDVDRPTLLAPEPEDRPAGRHQSPPQPSDPAGTVGPDVLDLPRHSRS